MADFTGNLQRFCSVCDRQVCQDCGGPQSSWSTGICDGCYRVRRKGDAGRRRETLIDVGVRKAARAIREIHVSDGAESPFCNECGHTYPCLTVRTLVELEG
jgi:hypothetical protein